MPVKVETQDRAVLPAGLLALAKTHMRIDWTYDDDFIKSVLARAIDRFQNVNEATLNPTTVLWTPATSDFTNGAITLPVRPVSEFHAALPPDDVTANYSLVLKWDSIHGIPIQQLLGAAAALSVNLTAGFATAAVLPPAVEDIVLRHAAHLYEHREILIPGREYVAPDLAMDATWWMPRA